MTVDYLNYFPVNIPEIFNILTHCFIIPMINEMLGDTEEFAIIISLVLIMYLMSGIYHTCAFLYGTFTILSVSSSQLLDHVTSQGMCVTFSFMFLILNNRRVRDAVIIITLFALGILLIIADVLYFSAFISLAAILTSIVVHSGRWGRAVRTWLFWITLLIGVLAFVMFFLWELSPWLHGFWHILIFLDGYLLTKIIRLFFIDRVTMQGVQCSLEVTGDPERQEMLNQAKTKLLALNSTSRIFSNKKRISVIDKLRELLSPPRDSELGVS